MNFCNELSLVRKYIKYTKKFYNIGPGKARMRGQKQSKKSFSNPRRIRVKITMIIYRGIFF
jgi:hypothetical protein